MFSNYLILVRIMADQVPIRRMGPQSMDVMVIHVKALIHTMSTLESPVQLEKCLLEGERKLENPKETHTNVWRACGRSFALRIYNN